MEPAAVEHLAAQRVDAAGAALVLTAAGQVGTDCLAGVVEGVDPLTEALRGQELRQGDGDRNRLVVEADRAVREGVY